MGLWEEEQARSSPICKANSYDKRIATSERSYGGIVYEGGVLCGGVNSQGSVRSTTKNANMQVKGYFR